LVYITGDKHRNFSIIYNFCQYISTNVNDVLIILGDAGINYYGDPHDKKLKNELSKLPITLFCIHGNHEMRPESICSYKESEYFKGTVYREDAYQNLIFAKDGEIYDINEKRCLTIGGANSIDKMIRLINRWGWWADEQPSDVTKCQVERRLNTDKWHVDLVLSHTCPYKYMPVEAFLPGFDQSQVSNDTEEWLDSIENKLHYSKWYCGHFHIEKDIQKIIFLYNSILAFE